MRLEGKGEGTAAAERRLRLSSAEDKGGNAGARAGRSGSEWEGVSGGRVRGRSKARLGEGPLPGRSGCGARVGQRSAFTLLEVMIALTIFFMAIFTILGSVSRSLGAARGLQQRFPDIGPAVADLMLTNRLEEGTASGDFGDAYPGCTWSRDVYLKSTNGFFQVDVTIHSAKGRQSVDWSTSILLWRPESRVSSFGRRL